MLAAGALSTGAVALLVYALRPETPPEAELPVENTMASEAPPIRDSAVAGAPADTRLVIPVEGVTPDRLRDTFSEARGLGRRHDAIDIEAPHGTPVLSVGASVVLKLFQSDRGGTTLYALAPDQRTIYYYAHLDRYAEGIREGQPLEAGELIGYVGDTGNANPRDYHLHFEISITDDPRRYWGGSPVNPYPRLRNGRTIPHRTAK
jgi:murein DD-endopeptidase MepM/ murein hydrolase activator NlpD